MLYKSRDNILLETCDSRLLKAQYHEVLPNHPPLELMR